MHAASCSNAFPYLNDVADATMQTFQSHTQCRPTWLSWTRLPMKQGASDSMLPKKIHPPSSQPCHRLLPELVLPSQQCAQPSRIVQDQETSITPETSHRSRAKVLCARCAGAAVRTSHDAPGGGEGARDAPLRGRPTPARCSPHNRAQDHLPVRDRGTIPCQRQEGLPLHLFLVPLPAACFLRLVPLPPPSYLCCC